MKDFYLRSWNLKDAPALAKAADNPHIAANLRNVFPHPYTLEDAQWFIRDCMEKEGEKQILHAIEADGAAAGSISIMVKDDIYEKSAELGYWLAERCWGQGIMTRAVQQICREAFEAFDIVRIFAEPFAVNAASRRVLEKAGFTCEGTMRDGVYKNGQIFSYCIYSLLRAEAEASDGR